jgi:site-specific DNA recombinase
MEVLAMMALRKVMKVCGYVRISDVRGREGQSFQSPEQQEGCIRDYAKAQGWRVAHVYTDLNVSGGTMIRQGIAAALAGVEQQKYDALVCADLDRFGRSAIETHEGIQRIERAGGAFVAVRQGINTADESGWAARVVSPILAALGEMERERIAENWSSAQSRAVERGTPIGKILLGYIVGRDAKGKRTGLEKDADTAWIVEAAFHASANHGLSAATDILREHVPSRSWTPSAVRALLASRTYLGELRHGEHVKHGTHEAIIDAKTWTLAQHPAKGLAANAAYPLSKAVHCASCQEPMTGSMNGAKRRAY